MHSASFLVKVYACASTPQIERKRVMKRLYCSKLARNRVYRELKRNGVTARRGSIEDISICPGQVEDFDQENPRAWEFGGYDRPSFFPVLYTLKVDD